MLQKTIQGFKFTGNILSLNLCDGHMGAIYIILYNSWVSRTFHNYLSIIEFNYKRVQSYFRKQFLINRMLQKNLHNIILFRIVMKVRQVS